MSPSPARSDLSDSHYAMYSPSQECSVLSSGRLADAEIDSDLRSARSVARVDATRSYEKLPTSNSTESDAAKAPLQVKIDGESESAKIQKVTPTRLRLLSTSLQTALSRADTQHQAELLLAAVYESPWRKAGSFNHRIAHM